MSMMYYLFVRRLTDRRRQRASSLNALGGGNSIVVKRFFVEFIVRDTCNKFRPRPT